MKESNAQAYIDHFFFSKQLNNNVPLYECPAPIEPPEPHFQYYLDFDGRQIYDCGNPLGLPYYLQVTPPINEPPAKCDKVAREQGLDIPPKYHKLINGEDTIYKIFGKFFPPDYGPFECTITLQCQTSCTPPQDKGNCDDNCNFSVNPYCPYYKVAGRYTATIPNGSGEFLWDDESPPEPVNDGDEREHTYDNAGAYDVMLNCNGGAQVCIKRVNVICEKEGELLPTSTPKPTGAPGTDCPPGYQCLHPCACNSKSLVYQLYCLKEEPENADDLSLQCATTTVNDPDLCPMMCGSGLWCCKGGASGTSWYKAKSTTFYKNDDIINPIPEDAVPFDGTDGGFCNHNPALSPFSCLTIDEAGAVMSEGFIDTGSAPVSYKGWETSHYDINTVFTPEMYIAYVKSRKQYTSINSIDDIGTGTTHHRIFMFNGNDITIESNKINQKKEDSDIVLLVDGDLTIESPGGSTQPFNEDSDISLAIVVTGTLKISQNIEEMNGIFIANDVDFAYDIPEGTTTENPLKINGGLVSFTSRECIDQRERVDNSKTKDVDETKMPTCFFVQDLKHYLGVLDMLSTRHYEWIE